MQYGQSMAAPTAVKCWWHAGELFFIGYQMDKKPACVWYAGLDKAGALQFDVRVDLPVGVPSAHAASLHHERDVPADWGAHLAGADHPA